MQTKMILTKEGKKFLNAVSIEYDKLYAGYRRQLPHPDRMRIEVDVLFGDLDHIPIAKLPDLFQTVRLTVNRWPTTADILDTYDKMLADERSVTRNAENYRIAEKVRKFNEEHKGEDDED